MKLAVGYILTVIYDSFQAIICRIIGREKQLYYFQMYRTIIKKIDCLQIDKNVLLHSFSKIIELSLSSILLSESKKTMVILLYQSVFYSYGIMEHRFKERLLVKASINCWAFVYVYWFNDELFSISIWCIHRLAIL